MHIHYNDVRIIAHTLPEFLEAPADVNDVSGSRKQATVTDSHTENHVLQHSSIHEF
jgi:hypothetical protein